MNSVKRASFAAIIGLCSLWATAGSVPAAESVAEPVVPSFAPGVLPMRTDWEQRVLGSRKTRAWRYGQPIPGQVAVQGGVSGPGVREVAIQSEPLPIESGAPTDIQYESMPGIGVGTVGACGPEGGMACGPCGDCGDMCGYDCGPCWPILGPGLLSCWPHSLSLFAGAHGFKGPVDFGRNGNFGLHGGVQWGAPLGGLGRWGYQLGFQAARSNFNGDQSLGELESDGRDQIFVTGGLFHRALCDGLQWAVAFDMLHDTYWDTADLNQVRAEISLVRQGCREIGFWGAFGTGDDQVLLDDRVVRMAPPTCLRSSIAAERRRAHCGGFGAASRATVTASSAAT